MMPNLLDDMDERQTWITLLFNPVDLIILIKYICKHLDEINANAPHANIEYQGLKLVDRIYFYNDINGTTNVISSHIIGLKYEAEPQTNNDESEDIVEHNLIIDFKKSNKVNWNTCILPRDEELFGWFDEDNINETITKNVMRRITIDEEELADREEAYALTDKHNEFYNQHPDVIDFRNPHLDADTRKKLFLMDN